MKVSQREKSESMERKLAHNKKGFFLRLTIKFSWEIRDQKGVKEHTQSSIIKGL